MVPIGDGIIVTRDTSFGTEICEELWASKSPHISMGQDGVEIFTNASGSHHQLRKLSYKVSLLKSASAKVLFNNM